jgi:hypothetical protein
VHGHPSLGGVALPAGRPRQPRGARRRGATELEPIVFRDVHRSTRRRTSAGRPSSGTSRSRPTWVFIFAWPSRSSRPRAQPGRSRSWTRSATASNGTLDRSSR